MLVTPNSSSSTNLQTPHDPSGATMLGPLPGMPFPYLVDLGSLTHCSRFSSYSTSSEAPPLVSWAVTKFSLSLSPSLSLSLRQPSTKFHASSLPIYPSQTNKQTKIGLPLLLKNPSMAPPGKAPSPKHGTQDAPLRHPLLLSQALLLATLSFK